MALEGMQKRFHALGAERAALKATSGPACAVRDAIRARIAVLDRQERALTERIKAIEAPVFDIDNERGAIARALKGKTGEPVTSEAQPPMTADQISNLIKSLNIDAVAVVRVEGSEPKELQPDPRIQQVMDVLGELAARIEALPKSQSMDTVYSDLRNFAQAVQLHDETIAKLQADLAETRRDIGAFAANLEKGAA